MDMVENGLRRWLPDDLMSGLSVLRDFAGIEAGGGGRSRAWLGALLPLFAGAALGYLLLPPLLAASAKEALFAILAGVMAVGALVAGFMLTMMLSSGRIERAESLTYEVVQAYARRLKWLMLSQAVTLVAAMLLTLVALVWLIGAALDWPVEGQRVLGALAAGLGLLSTIRCLLIPLQIFEIHQAALDDTVSQRLQETREKFSRGKE